MFSILLGLCFVCCMVGWAVSHHDLMHRVRQRVARIALIVGGPTAGLLLTLVVFADFIRDGRIEYVNTILTCVSGVVGIVVAVWRPFRSRPRRVEVR